MQFYSLSPIFYLATSQQAISKAVPYPSVVVEGSLCFSIHHHQASPLKVEELKSSLLLREGGRGSHRFVLTAVTDSICSLLNVNQNRTEPFINENGKAASATIRIK